MSYTTLTEWNTESIISIDTQKSFNNVQHPFMIKTSQQIRHRRNLTQCNKDHLWKAQTEHHDYWGKWNSFSLISGIRSIKLAWGNSWWQNLWDTCQLALLHTRAIEPWLNPHFPWKLWPLLPALTSMLFGVLSILDHPSLDSTIEILNI